MVCSRATREGRVDRPLAKSNKSPIDCRPTRAEALGALHSAFRFGSGNDAGFTGRADCAEYWRTGCRMLKAAIAFARLPSPSNKANTTTTNISSATVADAEVSTRAVSSSTIVAPVRTAGTQLAPSVSAISAAPQKNGEKENVPRFALRLFFFVIAIPLKFVEAAIPPPRTLSLLSAPYFIF